MDTRPKKLVNEDIDASIPIKKRWKTLGSLQKETQKSEWKKTDHKGRGTKIANMLMSNDTKCALNNGHGNENV